MKQLRIYFTNTEHNQTRWCYLVDGAENQHGDSLDVTFLKVIGNAKEIIFVVPQNWVYETQIEITDKNTKQLLSAAAYQLEEQLAEDVDLLHFAQGKEVNKVVPFIAIKHEKMKMMIEFEKQHHITANYIINEIVLCATPQSDEINVYRHEQHYLIKTSDCTKNITCNEPQLDFFLNHFLSLQSELKINRFDQKSIDVLEGAIDVSLLTNLKQKQYSQSHIWQEVVKKLLIPVSLLLLFGVFFILNLWLNNQQIAKEIKIIQSQQQVLVRSVLETDQSNKSVKNQLIKALQNQQGAEQDRGFLTDFYHFLNAMKSTKTVTLLKVDYKNKKLGVDVSANNLQQFDQLIASLKKHFKVTVSQMDSSNNISQGRFILEGI